MPGDLRIRLEGHLERVESWLHRLHAGFDEARKRWRYTQLADCLEHEPGESEAAVRRMAASEPQLRRLLSQLEALRARATELIAERAGALDLPADVRALEAEPIELQTRLFHRTRSGPEGTVAFALSLALMLWGLICARVWVAALGAALLPVAFTQWARSTVRFVVTPRRVLIGENVLQRSMVTRAILEANLVGMTPHDRAAQLVDSVCPPPVNGPPPHGT